MNTPVHDRQSIANAFKEAKKRISSGENFFICTALRDSRAGHRARKIIRQRMGYVEGDTLECWLSKHHWDWYLILHAKKMRAYRLAWLDILIQEFENQTSL